MTDATALLRECRALCEDGDGLIDSEALAARIDAYLAAAPTPTDARPCTCHPDDNPPVPCPRKYALSECRAAAPTPAQPVARVRIHRTGGNVGMAWSAIPVDDAPMMRDGDLLYAAPPARADAEDARMYREALRTILGWRERDRESLGEVLRWIEGIADAALRAAPGGANG